MLCTSLSAYSVTTNDNFEMMQFIEGFNAADLSWGTASARPASLSFWARSSLTGTFGGALNNSAFNRSYPFTYTISAADTWEYKTVTIDGDTSGTWIGATNGIGAVVGFCLGAGSGRSGTAGAWASSEFYSATGATSVVATNGATLNITGVQLEAGDTATPFEHRSFGTELALCQRYAYVPRAGGNFWKFAIANTLASGSQAFFYLPASMRATPTVSVSNIFTTQVGGSQTAISAITAVEIAGNILGVVASSATYTQNQNLFWQDSGGGVAFMTISAEL
jgi:hypothetical protein